MKLLKVAGAALNQTPLDWENNKANILAAIQAAKEEGVSLLALPELCICGYGCEDAFYSPGLRRTSRDVLAEILPYTQGILVSLGLPVLHDNALYNTACLVGNGRIVGFAAKRFLAGAGIHYEPRWFTPWPQGKIDKVTFEGQSFPIGDLCFAVGGVKIGFEICEDAWASNRPGTRLAQAGIDIILNPSASHFSFGKAKVRERFVLEGSRAFGTTYVYSNLLGNEAGRAIYDGGTMIASGEKMVAYGPRLGYRPFYLTTAVVDLDITRQNQAVRSRGLDESGTPIQEISFAFDFPTQIPEEAKNDRPAWEHSEQLKEEEFTRAITLGLYDYMRKSRSRGFVVSLSGGADSAAVATLVAQMVHFANNELGPAVLARNIGMEDLATSSPEQIVKTLLTCVYQATENSSETTQTAAKKLADALNATFYSLDVDPQFKSYINMIESALGSALNWQKDDIALQNIQARVRAPGVWMLANLGGKLLLATSNRSEAAVGYATMDGDTCGGLSPIAGIDKAFLRKWLQWVETEGSNGLGNIPEMRLINTQKPTAELRPQQAVQTDEDDLMPYDLLDAIERAAIGNHQVPLEVFLNMQAQFPEYQARPELLGSYVERFFLLWSRNQWKRERYAPSFHVDDKNLDPKTWCRFPILSGGFRRELNALKQHIQAIS